jgi:hypothetical protein
MWSTGALAVNRCPSCDFLVQVEWHTCRRCGAPLPLALREGTASLDVARLPARQALKPITRPVAVAAPPAQKTVATAAPTDTLLPHSGPTRDNLLPHGDARRRKRWHW